MVVTFRGEFKGGRIQWVLDKEMATFRGSGPFVGFRGGHICGVQRWPHLWGSEVATFGGVQR